MDYSVYYQVDTTNDLLSSLGTGFWLATIAVLVFYIVVMWKLYAKAGQPACAANIPIYKNLIMFKIIKMDWWHILILYFVPFASIVYMILIPLKLAKVFGKSTGFGVFAIFFSIIAYPILAFGEAKYQE